MCWAQARGLSTQPSKFVELRPERELRGSLATGFFSAKVRDEYVDVGQRTARKVLDSWTPKVFDTRRA